MKMNTAVFLFAVSLFMLTFVGFNSIAEDLFPKAYELKSAGENTPPQLLEFLNYLIATVTGLAAVFLRRLLKKWFPDFEEPNKPRKNNY